MEHTISAEAADLNLDIKTQPPIWLRFLGWSSLLGMPVACLMANMTSLINVFGGIGIVALIMLRLYTRKSLINSRWLDIALGLFFISILFHTIYPAVLENSHTMTESIHQGWDTIKALTACGLALILLNTKEKRATFLTLMILTMLITSIWALCDYYLCGFVAAVPDHGNPYRLSGTKGNPARYADTVYIALFYLWMLILTPALCRTPIQTWLKRGGALIAAAMPLLLMLRNKIPNEADGGRWLPGDGPHYPASTLTFSIIITLECIFACVLWYKLQSGEKAPASRKWFLLTTLGLLYLNIAMAGTRTTMAVLGLATLALLTLVKKTRKLIIAAVAVMVLCGTLALIINPQMLSLNSMRQRLYIWRTSVEVIKSYWPLGCGYGTGAFSDAWMLHRPVVSKDSFFYEKKLAVAPSKEVKPTHAHNLFIELLAERGLPGTLAFLFLWIVVTVLLIRRARALSRQENPEWTLPAIGATAMLLLLLHGQFEHPVRQYTEILFFLIAGVGLSVKPKQEDNVHALTDEQRSDDAARN